LPAVSPDVLAQRLRELMEAGVVHQSKLPPPAASQVFELTDWGAVQTGDATITGETTVPRLFPLPKARQHAVSVKPGRARTRTTSARSRRSTSAAT
jgi:hypothetical protein